MTKEGIIQKVIDSYDLGDIGEYIKQELIAGIKKEINEEHINDFMAQHAMVLSKEEVLSKLIGDIE